MYQDLFSVVTKPFDPFIYGRSRQIRLREPFFLEFLLSTLKEKIILNLFCFQDRIFVLGRSIRRGRVRRHCRLLIG